MKQNTTEDEDEAAEALLQLSKSDTIPDDDPELPLGVLLVDAAPVPILWVIEMSSMLLRTSNKPTVKQA